MSDDDEAPELGAEFFECPIVTRPGESLIDNVRKARMDITTKTLQDIRDRADKVLYWINFVFDNGQADKLNLVPHDRYIANAWYFKFSLLALEMNHAETRDDPEQHRKAVQDIAKDQIERIAQLEKLEAQYISARNRSADATNRALNLASGGVDDDGY